MASQSKNSNKTSSTKKKPIKKISPKKTSVKKRRRTKSKKISYIKRNIFIAFGFVLIASLIAFGYFLGQKEMSKQTYAKEVKEHYTTKELLNDLSRIKTKKPQNSKKIVNKNKTKISKKVLISQKKIVEQAPLQERGGRRNVQKQKIQKNTALAYRGKKPKLVIIIDDVHTKAQVQAIENLGMKITPSIFPPYQLAKHSNLLAKNLKHYMIHLPMESGSRQFNKQTKTLMTSFSDARIADRVMEIRKLFPKAKYVNNHTGSRFTSNYKAMKKLYTALRLEGFTFVDSFTASTSKVRQIAHEFGDAYVRRDIFIDNRQTIPYIHGQLKKAVAKAKKNGYAIAIGHPHKATIQALKSSKQILKDVTLVYIDEIYQKR